MRVPLAHIDIPSIYMKNAQRLPLPPRMAQCTPDTHAAVERIGKDVRRLGGQLYLSDLFRSYDMQFQSNLDYTTGKKRAFSPPPGGSLHEAGRALDLDLANLKVSLKEFWVIARKHGVYPIITKPDSRASEAWHFDCRGSHQLVYEYYSDGRGTDMKPYAAMAASAILSIGVQVDRFGPRQREAAIQSYVIRLGQSIGNIDGRIGRKTEAALAHLGVSRGPVDDVLQALERLLEERFPGEYGSTRRGSSRTRRAPR